MTLVQLEYIVALDNHRHFVQAAKSCFVTQPTLTMQIKKLEEELNVVIFDRHRTPLVPTKEGAKILEKARDVLREARQLRTMVKSDKELLSGKFRIAVIPTLAPYILPLFWTPFLNEFPELDLKVEEEQSDQIIEKLKNDELDMAILVTPVEDRQIKEHPVFYEAFLAYTAQNQYFYKQEMVEPSDIENKNLLILNEGHCFRNQVLNICSQDSKRKSKFVYESGSIETLIRMVDKGYGYTLIPELGVPQHPKDPKMIKKFKEPQPVREVSVITHKSFVNDLLLEKVIDTLQSVIPESMKKVHRRKRIAWK
ncbi:MAG: hydrogen peroxide-inducible genes activator [Chitinophagales bacterium]